MSASLCIRNIEYHGRNAELSSRRVLEENEKGHADEAAFWLANGERCAVAAFWWSEQLLRIRCSAKLSRLLRLPA